MDDVVEPDEAQKPVTSTVARRTTRTPEHTAAYVVSRQAQRATRTESKQKIKPACYLLRDLGLEYEPWSSAKAKATLIAGNGKTTTP